MTETLPVGQLDLNFIKNQLTHPGALSLTSQDEAFILKAEKTVADIIANEQIVYGINTGFGLLANTRIENDKLTDLQRRILLSHAAGVGDYLTDDVVRCILLLKINALARGHSGVSLNLLQSLLRLYNLQIYPCIPAKGSVGASGDLAPLAHLACVLIGVGKARYQGNIIEASEALKIAQLQPLTLQAKEGLALINGTQVSTALLMTAFFKAQRLCELAIVTGSLSIDAAMGSDAPFRDEIHQLRGQVGQIAVAKCYRELLVDSEIRQSHEDCDRVQDPYSLRCQPQVMGAIVDQMQFVGTILQREANAVTDNPLVFSESQEILSGGNFHAEPIALAADNLALCLAEIGALTERRIALLIDPNFSQLPAFLVANGGLNSGFMIAQVTAAALASDNKALAHPASVDSLPTSANQEDHVSMATNAALRLFNMLENVEAIIAIELLAAGQGISLRAPLQTSPKLQQVMQQLRERVSLYEEDRYFAHDIAQARACLQELRLTVAGLF